MIWSFKLCLVGEMKSGAKIHFLMRALLWFRVSKRPIEGTRYFPNVGLTCDSIAVANFLHFPVLFYFYLRTFLDRWFDLVIYLSNRLPFQTD